MEQNGVELILSNDFTIWYKSGNVLQEKDLINLSWFICQLAPNSHREQKTFIQVVKS